MWEPNIRSKKQHIIRPITNKAVKALISATPELYKLNVWVWFLTGLKMNYFLLFFSYPVHAWIQRVKYIFHILSTVYNTQLKKIVLTWHQVMSIWEILIIWMKFPPNTIHVLCLLTPAHHKSRNSFVCFCFQSNLYVDPMPFLWLSLNLDLNVRSFLTCTWGLESRYNNSVVSGLATSPCSSFANWNEK